MTGGGKRGEHDEHRGHDARDAAFVEFVAARYTHLCRTAFLLCGDWGYAEDIVQVTLARVFRTTRRGGVEHLDAYTRAALLNTATSWWRRRWRGETPSDAPPEQAAPAAYEQVELRAALLDALGRLPAPQRAVLVLRYFEDMTEAETAAVLGCSVGTVKSRTARALHRMREHGFVADGEAIETNATGRTGDSR
jgi:RNA polymerase sigma-70 factor (sigma-E family)